MTRRIAFLSLLVFIAGLSFKTLSWHGGTVLMAVGLLAYAFLHFPLGIFHLNNLSGKQIAKFDFREVGKHNLVVSAFAGLAMGLGNLGLLFHLMHWPGAQLVLFLALPLLLYSFLLARKHGDDISPALKNNLFPSLYVVLGMVALLLVFRLWG